ncbi:hypothetical protein AALO_G00098460 [Alosa alosa]|uniref:P2X purinoreceptor 7 intracellular domain-containing protein n=1 Tax=Alosa alosa TaxID=278164 RepID=A0AAV6GXC1_9TELE|nr:hypothetical protein AALO_G00098460 [Alosa alosa]
MEEQEVAEAAATTAEADDLPAADEELQWLELVRIGGACALTVRQWTQNKSLGVLETYFRIPKVNWKRHPKPTGPNGRLSVKQFRLTAYSHFLEWVLQGERLGRGRCVVLPACVVQAIRQKYPAPDGQYCGHQEVEDAQEEL